MITADLTRQLMIRTNNEVGSLSNITSLITEMGINVVAICAYSVDDNVSIMLVTDDNNAAVTQLEENGYSVNQEEVILLSLDNQNNSIQLITDKLAESGVDLTLIYGSTDRTIAQSKVVLISNDNLEAMMVIKTEIERG